MKILIYSHDTFGLGHLRRARTIANHIADNNRGAEIAIVSGSPVGTAYDYSPGVRIVQIPPVRKQPDGSYRSAEGLVSFETVIAARERAINALYAQFQPDLVIIDKEPFGLHREAFAMLERHRQMGRRSVLGLREVLDAPEELEAEWQRKGVVEHLEDLYDEIWIYGPSYFHDPLAGIALPAAVKTRVRFTGFLQRDMPEHASRVVESFAADDFLLVTTGGGGDGHGLMAAASAAARTEAGRRHNFVLALGAFMIEPERADIRRRTAGLSNVELLDFRSDHEILFAGSRLVIGMCGYNTFCEVLSADKRALFAPRTHPRREQVIRASRAAELGWASMIDADAAADTGCFMDAVARALVSAPPSAAAVKPALDGLEHVNGRVRALMTEVVA